MANRIKHAQDIATRFQVYLERLKTSEVQDFTTVFSQIDKATRQILNALDTPNLGELTRAQLAKLLKQLKEENTSLLEKATEGLYNNLGSIAGYSAAFEAKAIGQIISDKLTVPDYAEAYKAAVDQPIQATGAKLTDFIDTWSEDEVYRLNNVVQRGWAQGSTVQDMIQEIRGTRALNYEDGVLAIGSRNAEAIARTAIQHVASTARMATWQANSDVVTGYKWVSTLDSRTTQICRSLDGQVFKIGEGPTPPAHYNCRSTTVAELDPSLDFLDEGATRASIDGPVDADETYYSWLGDQPEAFQDAALGPVRAQLFRDGGLTADKFAALNLNKNFQPLTLAQMQELEPTAFEKAGITLPDR